MAATHDKPLTVQQISTEILSRERGLVAVHAFVSHCGCALDVIERIRGEGWFADIESGPTIDGVLWAARRLDRGEYKVADEMIEKFPEFYRD